jgi:hypothetical protein
MFLLWGFSAHACVRVRVFVLVCRVYGARCGPRRRPPRPSAFGGRRTAAGALQLVAGLPFSQISCGFCLSDFEGTGLLLVPNGEDDDGT